MKEIERELLAKVNYAAQVSGVTQRVWVIQVLTEAVSMKTGKNRRVAELADAVARDVSKAATEFECTGSNPVPAVKSKTDFKRIDAIKDSEIDLSEIPELGTEFFAEAQVRRVHVAKECRVYGCGLCKATGLKDPQRGL